MLADAIIIGSGAAGAAAAHALRDRNIIILDVGFTASPTPTLDKSFYDLRQGTENLSMDLLGSKFESLNNIDKPYLSSKLKSPNMRFITKDSGTLSPFTGNNFEGS